METSIVVIRLENVLKVSVPEMTEIDLPIMKYLVRTAKQLINGEELPIPKLPSPLLVLVLGVFVLVVLLFPPFFLRLKI